MKPTISSTFGLALAISTILAVTAQAQTYTLTANVSVGGSVTKSPNQASYAPGTQVTVTAITNAGYLLANWWGDINSTNNPLVITMNSNITVTANFSLIAPIQNYTNGFDTAAGTNSWIPWWGPPNPVVSWDSASDAGGNPSSGSLKVSEAFTGAAGEQFMVFGTLDNAFPWDNHLALDCTRCTNLVFDLKVAPGTRPTRNNDYGPLDLELVDIYWNQVVLGTYEIPLSATNWTHVVQPINPALAGLNRITGIGLHIWSSGTFTNPLTFWVDNVTLQAGVVLGATAMVEAPAAGSDSVVLTALATNTVWTATANAAWLHLSVANQGGTGSTNLVFTFDANPGATRTGTLTIAGQMLTVAQGGSTYIAAPGPLTTLASSGLNQPIGVALDSAGNVYFADYNNNAIEKWTAANNTVSTLVSTGLNHPWGVAVDSAGNVYFCDRGNRAVKKWTAAGGTVTTLISSGLYNPSGLALDSAGNLYIADAGGGNHNLIENWTAATQTLTNLVSSGLVNPYGVAVDAAGNVYIADTGNNSVKRWTAANGGVTTVVSGLGQPYAVSVDGAGNVYIAARSSNAVMEWVAASNVVTTLISGFLTLGLQSPEGVAVDGLGNVFVADTWNRAIKELPRAFVDPTPRWESPGAGTDALPAVLPATENLLSPFAPTSDQAWLTIAGVANGVVSFAFSPNTGTSNRTAHITLLGQAISINQFSPYPQIVLSGNGQTITNGAITPSVTNGTDFGGVSGCAPTARTFTVSNWGGAPLHLTGAQTVAVSGPQAAEFTVTQQPVSPVAGPGGTATFQVTFVPARLGLRTATLTITSDDPNQSSYVFAIQGIGILPLITVGPAVLPSTALGVTYNQILTATGGAGPYSFTLASGSLPAGLTLANSAQVSTLAGLAGSSGTNDGPGSSARFYHPQGGATDTAGNLYVADTYNHTIRKMTSAGIVSTLAGLAGSPGSSDGVGRSARFNLPYGVAVDSAGNVYVADSYNQTIRKIAPDGTVTTLAGLAGVYGSADGTGSSARFNYPYGIAVDSAGNVYVGDTHNQTVRKITPAGVVTTLAGLAGAYGSADGTGSSARFNGPEGVAVDGADNVYVADSSNHTIRKVTPAGVVSTLAGLAGTSGSSDGVGSSARFFGPTTVAVDSTTNVYVTDFSNFTIRKVSPAGVVTTLAGLAGFPGSTDGASGSARFNYPFGIAVDFAGNIYVADSANNTIRKLVPVGVLSGTPSILGISSFVIMATDANGCSGSQSYVLADVPLISVLGNNGLSITNGDPSPSPADGTDFGSASGCAPAAQSFTITNWGGAPLHLTGTPMVAVSGPQAAEFTVTQQPAPTVTNGPGGATIFRVTFTPAGLGLRTATVTITSDAFNQSPYVFAIQATGMLPIITLSPAGLNNETVGGYIYYAMLTATGGAGPYSFAFASGSVPAGLSLTNNSVVSTLAGLAGSSGSTNGTGSAARFRYLKGTAADSAGNVYVADEGNNTIRQITPLGVVTTLAGAGVAGYADLTGTNAMFYQPFGVATDSGGNVYVADTWNHTIRKIAPGGAVTTLAGRAGVGGHADLTGTNATFNLPEGVAVDGSGNVYVADTWNHTIRKVTPAGTVTTFAGRAGIQGSTDATGTNATFSYPAAIAFDLAANLYVTDSGSNIIRKITPAGAVTTLAGRAGISGEGDETGTNAVFNYPSGIAVDSLGNVYVADFYGDTIRRITPARQVTTLAGHPYGSYSGDGPGFYAYFYEPWGVAADSMGNLYVGDSVNHTVRKVVPGTLLLSEPLAPATNAFVITATDTNNCSGGQSYSFDVTCPTITISPAILPNAVLGAAYSQTLYGVGGNYPYTFAITSGSLPSGMSLTTNGVPSGEAMLSGTPNVPGTNIFAVKATDFYGCSASQTYTQAVPCGGITLSPTNLSDGSMGIFYSQTLTATGGLPPYTFAPYTPWLPAGLSLSTGGVLSGTPSAYGTSSFAVSATDSNGCSGVQYYTLSVGCGSISLSSGPLSNGTIGVAYSQNLTASGGGAPYAFTLASGSPPLGLSITRTPLLVSTIAGLARCSGTNDAATNNARFNNPQGVASDSAGNLYVADTFNHAIRKITPAGEVATLAGLAGTPGTNDGTGGSARFNQPYGIALDSATNIYVADCNNSTIRKITPAGTVTTLAGVANVSGTNDGTGSAARFDGPRGVAVDSTGIIYVADHGSDTIRKITPAGVVTTLAGLANSPGTSDDTGGSARFNGPQGLAVDNAGNVYVADTWNFTIRRMTPAGVVTTLAGAAGASGTNDGIGGSARFHLPCGVAADSAGNVYVADYWNSAIRKITPAGEVTTLAGRPGTAGSVDGIGGNARFYYPGGLAVDNGLNVYVADTVDDTIRKVAPPGVINGTPSALGTSTFVINATDAGNCSGSNSYTLSVLGPAITVLGNGLTITNGDLAPRTADGTDFGATLVGANLSQTFAISNASLATLHLTGTPLVTVSNAQASDFTLAVPPASTVAAHGTATFQVTFTPAGVSQRRASLSIASDDPTNGLYVFSIQGTGGSTQLAARYNSPGDLPLTTSSPVLSGKTVNFTLNFAPNPGTELTVVKNTGLNFINSVFNNLENGQQVTLSYGGANYKFVANYYGGSDGRDLVLDWANNWPFGWGLDADHQLGTTYDVAGSVSLPAAVDTGMSSALYGKRVVAMATGVAHSLALCSDGAVMAWGANSSGQLGNNSYSNSPLPVETTLSTLPGDNRVAAIAAGWGHSLALMPNGTVGAWGKNDHGQLGNNGTANSDWPVVADNTSGSALYTKTVVAIAAGGYHSLALCSDGTVAAWGAGSSGQLGIGIPFDSGRPGAVSRASALAGKMVVAVAAGGSHSLALCSDGTVAAWGYNADGELGNNSTANSLVPVRVDTTPGVSALSGKTVVAVAAGWHHSLALCSDGTVAGWGYGVDGELGYGWITNCLTPTAVYTGSALAGKTVVAISAGYAHSLALCSDGSLAAWGDNSDGELGNNLVGRILIPRQVNLPGLGPSERYVHVFSGPAAMHTLALAGEWDQPQISVTGNGLTIANGDITPSTADGTDFGHVLKLYNGTASQTRSFVIQNPGNGPLNLIGTPVVSLSGAGASAFTVAQPHSRPVASSGAMAFQVTFSPTNSDAESAIVSISNSVANQTPYTFTVQGTGTSSGMEAVYSSPYDVPIRCYGFQAGGNIYLTLNFAPSASYGNVLTVVDGQGTPITDTFVNLRNGQAVTLGYRGNDYTYVAHYNQSPCGGNNMLTLCLASNAVPWAVKSVMASQVGLDVPISYTVNAPCTVSVAVSTNGGATYEFPAPSFSGVTNVAAGYGDTVNTIVWHAGADWPGQQSSNIRFRVTADFGLFTSTLCSGPTTVDTLNSPITVSGRVRANHADGSPGDLINSATVTMAGVTNGTDSTGTYYLYNVYLSNGVNMTITAPGFLPWSGTQPVHPGASLVTLADSFLWNSAFVNTNFPKVTGLAAQYDGAVFLPGIDFQNQYTADVAWFGLTPERVDFYVDGGLFQSVWTTNTQATFSINVGEPFRPSTTHGYNTVTAVAVATNIILGERSSAPVSRNVTVIPSPAGVNLTRQNQLAWDPAYDERPQDPMLLHFKVNSSAGAFPVNVPYASTLGLDLSSQGRLTYSMRSGAWSMGSDKRCKSAGFNWSLWNAQFSSSISASGTASETGGFPLDLVNVSFSFDDKQKILSIHLLDFLGPEGTAVSEVLQAVSELGIDVDSIERIDIYGIFGLDASLTWSCARNQFTEATLTPSAGVQFTYNPDIDVASLEADLTGTLSVPLQFIPTDAWKVTGQITFHFAASAFWVFSCDHTWVLIGPGTIASGGSWGSQTQFQLPMLASDGRPMVFEGVLLEVSNTAPRVISRDYLKAGPPQFLAQDSPSKALAASAGGTPRDNFLLMSRAPVKGSVGWKAGASAPGASASLSAPQPNQDLLSPAPLDATQQSPVSQADLMLLQNTFTYSQPAIASCSNELMLLFVVDNGDTNNSLQFTDIGWSRWYSTNGGTSFYWSTPQSIETNMQAEYVPQVKFDGNGDAIAVWQRVADSTFNQTNVAALAAQMEIVWAWWSRASGAWSTPAALTAHDHLHNTPLLCGPMANGNLLLVWTENQQNLLRGTNGPGADTVNWREWSATNQTWSVPQVLISGLSNRLSQALAGAGTNAVYAWTQDLDGVLTTNDTDQEVFYVTYTNGGWSAPVPYTPTGTANRNVRAAVSAAGDTYLLWDTDAGLVMDRNFSGQYQVARPASQTLGADYAVTVGPNGNLALLWQAVSTNGAHAHYQVYDPVSGTWGQDALLCNDTNTIERAFAGEWDNVGNLTVAYDKQQLFYTNVTATLTNGNQIVVSNIVQRGQTDLMVTKRALVKDLALGAGDFTVAGVNYMPGDPLTLTAIARNVGNVAVSNVVVSFYNGNPTNGTLITNVTLPGWLEAGASNVATAVWVVPGPAGTNTLFAIVNQTNLASEFNESNNVQSVSIGGTDLAVSLVSYLAETNGAMRVIALVQNVGAPAATNSLLAIRNTNAPLATVPVPMLQPGKSAQVALDLPAGTQPQQGTVLYTLHADDQGSVPDVNPNNNFATFAVSLWIDSDGDGIPDSWMMRYFGHATGLAADNSRAQDDADGDGMSNLAEYLAGTDPTDPHSYLRINSLTIDGTNGVQVVWGSATNKSYSVQRSMAVDGSVPFWPVVEHLPSTPPENTYWDTTATNSSAYFYRIKVE
jgi:alpha-tubulin suppressor-like RCC1 family protein/DNA-binding beta-propeller fold protein YncE